MPPVSVKIRPFHIFIFTTVVFLTFHGVLAVPFMSLQGQEQNNSGLLAHLTSRFIGGCLRIVSKLWQWLPTFPEWMRPSKPMLMLVKPTSIPMRDRDFSSEEINR